MSAILCSKPQSTKIITGQKLIISFPVTVFAAKAAHTAIQTKTLQRIPRIKASWKDCSTREPAASTTLSARCPPNKSGICPYTTKTATIAAPKKFPTNTKNQFLSISLILTFFCKTLMIIRLFPVKSSLPATSTIAIPAGNTMAPKSFPRDAFSTVAEAVVAPTPAKPIKAPAKKPRISIFQADSLTL